MAMAPLFEASLGLLPIKFGDSRSIAGQFGAKSYQEVVLEMYTPCI